MPKTLSSTGQLLTTKADPSFFQEMNRLVNKSIIIKLNLS